MPGHSSNYNHSHTHTFAPFPMIHIHIMHACSCVCARASASERVYNTPLPADARAHTHNTHITHTHTHTHTHIHVWGGFRGIGYLAAKLGTWIIPHFHGVYSYDVPRNIAISRPKMCKKKLHNRYDFLPVTGEKIELSNNARGHPIACIYTTPRLLHQRFLDLGISPLFLNSPLTWDEVCVCPRIPPYTYTHTHTHTHTYIHTYIHIHTLTQTYTHLFVGNCIVFSYCILYLDKHDGHCILYPTSMTE